LKPSIADKLFNRYIKPLKRDNDINIMQLAEKTGGLSPSDIRMICEEALKQVIIRSLNTVSQGALLSAIDTFNKRESVRTTAMGDSK